MKYLLLLLLLSFNTWALTIQEYQELKSAAYQSIKDHMEVHQNEELKSIQKVIFPKQAKLLKAVSTENAEIEKLFAELKESGQSSDKYKILRNIEFQLITEVKDEEEYAELYQAWNQARLAYENKKNCSTYQEGSSSW